jgi:hypothetical protein
MQLKTSIKNIARLRLDRTTTHVAAERRVPRSELLARHPIHSGTMINAIMSTMSNVGGGEGIVERGRIVMNPSVMKPEIGIEATVTHLSSTSLLAPNLGVITVILVFLGLT